MVVRSRVRLSMGHANHVRLKHLKKLFYLHLTLAILSVLWHTIPSYERYEHRDQSNQEGDLLHLRL
jgi:hypothetical protein